MKLQKPSRSFNPAVSKEPDHSRFGDLARLLKYPVGSEPKLLWPAIIYAGIIIGLQVISPETRVLSFTGLLALAAFRRRGPVQALSLSIFATFANGGLAPETPALSFLKWMLIAVCAVKLAITFKSHLNVKMPGQHAITVYTIVICILALVVSSNRELSVLKLLSWYVTAQIIFVALSDRRVAASYWLDWLFSLYVALLLFSLPLLFFPVGRWLNGRSFQGVFSHPQTFGVYIAPFTAVVTVGIIRAAVLRWHAVLIAALAWTMMFVSQCRTAVLAVSLGIAASLFIFLLRQKGKRTNWLQPYIVIRICLLGAIALVLAPAFGDSAVSGLSTFLSKGSSGSIWNPIFEKGGIVSSRESLVAPQLEQFRQKPIGGTGFGLAPENVAQQVQTSDLYGLPLSAPTEPGFLPLALLAQTGIIGAAAWCLMLFPLSRRVSFHAPLEMAILFWTVTLTTLGEMTFFAAGGLGLQLWLLLGLCARISAERRPRRSSVLTNSGRILASRQMENAGFIA
jgi:O-Antigen ligase